MTARWWLAAVATVVLIGFTTPNWTYASTGHDPGSLIETTAFTDVDPSVPPGTTSTRVKYWSRSGLDGSETEVSGAVFLPPGPPPAGGWPVIALAHGTTGVNRECAPSLSPDLRGEIATVATFLRLHLAVAATDYQGLGAPGDHPYLDAKTAGFNVIDSVRALRAVSHDVSSTWAAYGRSQGGGATWAANEQAATYAPELHLVGTVSVVPTADMSDYPSMAAAQTLNPDQVGMYTWLLIGIQRTRRDFNIDDYRRGLAKDKWDVASGCAGPAGDERNKLLGQLTPADLVPATPEAQQRLVELLAGMALPQQSASAPMLVIYSGQDTYVPPQATMRAIERACARGDTIDVVFQPGKGHGDVDDSPYGQWLGDRLMGLPAPSTC